MPSEIAEKENLWERALAEIELSISRPSFLTWFQNTSIAGQNDDIVTLSVPNTFVKEWLSNKYHKVIINALRALSPSIRNVEYVICSQPLTGKKSIPSFKLLPRDGREEQLGFDEMYIDKVANLNPRYTFDNFIVGSFNELAHAAAQAVTKNLGSSYNPLFIYGGTGLGKTHLLQAIGNKIKQDNPNTKVQYLTSEKFANEFLVAMTNNAFSSFKEKYRQYDLLLVDDIQFFSGKMKIRQKQDIQVLLFNSKYAIIYDIIYLTSKVEF